MSKKRNGKKSRTVNAVTRIENVVEKVAAMNIVTNPENMINLNKSGVPTTKHLKTSAMLSRIARGIPDGYTERMTVQLVKKLHSDFQHVQRRGFIFFKEAVELQTRILQDMKDIPSRELVLKAADVAKKQARKDKPAA